MSENFPLWETELRALVCEEIKNQVTSITSDQNYKLMWARTPFSFVQKEAAKLLLESWELFPAWRAKYEKTSQRGSLHELWGTLDIEAKRSLASGFKKFFYEHSARVCAE